MSPPLYILLEELVADLQLQSTTSITTTLSEHLLVLHNTLFYQSVNGFVRLNCNSSLGKSIATICENCDLDPPHYDETYFYLDNPNNFMGERPVSIVDATLQVEISQQNKLVVTVVDLREPSTLYNKRSHHHHCHAATADGTKSIHRGL